MRETGGVEDKMERSEHSKLLWRSQSSKVSKRDTTRVGLEEEGHGVRGKKGEDQKVMGSTEEVIALRAWDLVVRRVSTVEDL